MLVSTVSSNRELGTQTAPRHQHWNRDKWVQGNAQGQIPSRLHLQPLPRRTSTPWGWRCRHQPRELLALGGTHLERRKGTLLWVHAGACAGGGGTWMLQMEEWKGRKQPTMPVLRAAAAPTELVTRNCWSKTSPDTPSPLSPDVFALSSWFLLSCQNRFENGMF